MFLFFLGLLLCYCITHNPPGFVLVAAAYNSSRAMSSFLCDSHRRCFCVYMCARSCVCNVCCHRHTIRPTRTVFFYLFKAAAQPHSRNNHYSIAVQQQQYNGSRVLAFVTVVTVYYTYGWCTARYRTTTTFSRPVKHTSPDFISGIRSI